mgnify:CR=1 FL=1
MRDFLDILARNSKYREQKVFQDRNPIGSSVRINPESFAVVDSYGLVINPGELSDLGISSYTIGIVRAHYVDGNVTVEFQTDLLDEPIVLNVPFIYLIAADG